MNTKLAYELGKWTLATATGVFLAKAALPSLKQAVGLTPKYAPAEDIPEAEVDPSVDGEDFREEA